MYYLCNVRLKTTNKDYDYQRKQLFKIKRIYLPKM